MVQKQQMHTGHSNMSEFILEPRLTLHASEPQETLITVAVSHATTARASGAVYIMMSVKGYLNATQSRPNANMRYWRYGDGLNEGLSRST